MSCQDCASHLARVDQLERDLAHKTTYETRLLNTISDKDDKIKSLERNLRECMEELRLRRSVTGYLPHLDQPLDS